MRPSSTDTLTDRVARQPGATDPGGIGRPGKHDDRQRHARLAGLMYLLVMAAYLAGLVITRQLSVPGDPVATARQALASETLCRAGLALQLVASLATIVLAGAFHALLKPVSPDLALLALLWRTAEATLGGVAAAVSFIALDSLHLAGDLPGGLAGPAVSRLFSAGYSVVFHVTLVFFAPGSTLFFWLLLRSGFIPRALAGLGLVASLAVLLLGMVQLVVPAIAGSLVLGWAPIFIAEIATGIYLLAFGARPSLVGASHRVEGRLGRDGPAPN